MASASVLAVLKQATAALTQGDAPTLERLTAQAEQAVAPAEEEKAAREQFAALGLLLVLTRRNLSLLRGASGREYSRGCRG